MKIEAKGTLAVEAGEVGEPALRISYDDEHWAFVEPATIKAKDDRITELEALVRALEDGQASMLKNSQDLQAIARLKDDNDFLTRQVEAQKDIIRKAMAERNEARAKRKVRVKVTCDDVARNRWIAYCEIGSRKSYGTGEGKQEAIDNLIGFVHTDLGIEVELVPEKTPGQVLYESQGYLHWEKMTGDQQGHYEKQAAAVIAHHEGAK